MKIENQVCSLEQAKKLKELGVTPVALFVHYNASGKWWIGDSDRIRGYQEMFYAYNVAELSVMIDGAFVSALNYYGKWEAWPNPNNTNLSDYDYDLPIHGKYDTEAECLAGNMIDFINNGILSVDKINKRLIEA